MLVDAFAGRQPIFNRDWEVVAYEVLYRSGTENNTDFSNPKAATSQVLGNNQGFLNMTRDLLVDRSLAGPDV